MLEAIVEELVVLGAGLEVERFVEEAVESAERGVFVESLEMLF